MKNTSEKSLRGLMHNCTGCSKWGDKLKNKSPFLKELL
jgi:hypothetical protein